MCTQTQFASTNDVYSHNYLAAQSIKKSKSALDLNTSSQSTSLRCRDSTTTMTEALQYRWKTFPFVSFCHSVLALFSHFCFPIAILAINLNAGKAVFIASPLTAIKM